MKKLFACLLVLILAFSMSFVTASAAASPEANGIVSGITVTDADGEEASIELIKIDGKVKDYFQTGLKELKKEAGDNSLKVVAQYKVKVIGNPKFNLDVVLDVLGMSSSSKVYLMIKKGNVQTTAADNTAKVVTLSNVYDIETKNLVNTEDGVTSIKPDVEDGKIAFSIEKGIQTLAIVTDSKTASNVEKENDVLSPQTFDATTEKFDATPYVAAVAFVSILAIAILPKKIKNS